MEELSTEARSLIDSVKQADHPPAGAKEQTWSALSSRIAEGATATATTAATTSTGAGMGAVIKVVLGVVGAGVLAFVALRPGDPEPAPAPREPAPVVMAEPTPPAIEPPAVEPVPSPAVVEEPAVEEPAEVTEPGTTRARKRRSKSSPDTLAEEAMLLAKLRQAASRGYHDAVLSMVAEHRKKYPRGALAPEFAAQKVVALCGVGRVDQARKAAQRFLRKWPRNPQAAQVRASCAGSK